MIPQAKILRVFKLISLLKSRGRTIKDLATSLETSERSVYRYIELLEEIGFIIDKDFTNRFFIHTNENEDEIAFNPNEAVLMKELLETSARNHPLKESLLKKLYLNSDLKVISKNIFKAKTGKIVSRLAEGIQYNQQVILKDYYSAHSEQVSDRLIEPFDFTENYTTVMAVDLEDQTIKHFKVERIGEVKLLEKSQVIPKHKGFQNTDLFGMSGPEEIEIRLKMKPRAYLLLREEYPAASTFLSKKNDSYYFKGSVRSFEGVGRFVLGLIDSIEVLAPKAFRQYLKEKASILI